MIHRRTLLAAGGAMMHPGAGRSPAEGARIEVFGHRGACALRPEHTLASYAKAIEDGADFVEPDLVCTRDGVLVARHEPLIDETTDVAAHPEFAGRRTSRVIDGSSYTGWFATDFTLAELKTLRARERLPKIRPQNTRWDGAFEIPTFEEVIEFVAAEAARRGRTVGLVPELKHSAWHAEQGLPLERRFLAAIGRHPFTRTAPLVIQSFEVNNLRRLRPRLGRAANVRLMQLIGEPAEHPGDLPRLTYADLTSPDGLDNVAAYADIIAPPLRSIIPLDKDGRLTAPTRLVADAHAVGLRVGTWTFRPENRFLAADFRNGAGENARNPRGSIAEIRRYLAAGLDGFFTDDPALGRRAVAG
jgi:glycerophosphoryl diester phosphodiesterase